MRRIYAEEPIFGKASNRLAATPMVGCNPSRVLEFAAIHHHAMNARVTDANDFAFFLHALRATDTGQISVRSIPERISGRFS